MCVGVDAWARASHSFRSPGRTEEGTWHWRHSYWEPQCRAVPQFLHPMFLSPWDSHIWNETMKAKQQAVLATDTSNLLRSCGFKDGRERRGEKGLCLHLWVPVQPEGIVQLPNRARELWVATETRKASSPNERPMWEIFYPRKGHHETEVSVRGMGRTSLSFAVMGLMWPTAERSRLSDRHQSVPHTRTPETGPGGRRERSDKFFFSCS